MEECSIGCHEMIVAHNTSAEFPEPCVASFDDPASLVTSELASAFVAPLFTVLAVGHI